MAEFGTILVETEQLVAAASTLSTHLTSVEQCFEGMERTMSASTSYWVGTAGDAHRKLYTDRRAEIEEIIARYREHITDLNTIAGVYIQEENRASAQAEELPTFTF